MSSFVGSETKLRQIKAVKELQLSFSQTNVLFSAYRERPLRFLFFHRKLFIEKIEFLCSSSVSKVLTIFFFSASLL
jgi:hypothetical protein